MKYWKKNTHSKRITYFAEQAASNLDNQLQLMMLENIDTELGNRIIEQLRSEGWKLRSQYSPFAFDKGIDYDSYTLRNKKVELVFEWDNWFEWKVNGPDEILQALAKRFVIKPL